MKRLSRLYWFRTSKKFLREMSTDRTLINYSLVVFKYKISYYFATRKSFYLTLQLSKAITRDFEISRTRKSVCIRTISNLYLIVSNLQIIALSKRSSTRWTVVDCVSFFRFALFTKHNFRRILATRRQERTRICKDVSLAIKKENRVIISKKI